MGKRFTPNFEEDADRIAPVLARCGSAVACAAYFWLHSRAFGRETGIHISISWLAKELGVSRSTLSEAVKTLEACGLVEYEGRRGNGGGSVFTVLGLTSLQKRQSSACGTLDDRPGQRNAVATGHITDASSDMIKRGEDDGRYNNESRFALYDR